MVEYFSAFRRESLLLWCLAGVSNTVLATHVCRVPEQPRCISSGSQELQKSFHRVNQTASPALLPPVGYYFTGSITGNSTITARLMMFRNGTELENTGATGWWTAHLQCKLRRTSHGCTGSTDLHICVQGLQLWHVQFLLHICWTSLVFKTFLPVQLLLPLGFLGSYPQLASDILDSLWRVQLIWLLELNPLHFLLFLIIIPALTQGWSCQSVGNVIQYTTWSKCAKRSLPTFPQPFALISHINRVRSRHWTIAFIRLWAIMHQKIFIRRGCPVTTPFTGTWRLSRSISLEHTASLGAASGWQITDESSKRRT